MPKYLVEDEVTGKKFEFEGDREPTQTEIEDYIFGTISRPSPFREKLGEIKRVLTEAAPEELRPTFGEMYREARANVPLLWAAHQIDRPVAAIRSLVAGKSPLEGFTKPETAPPISESILSNVHTGNDLVDVGISALGGAALDVGTYWLVYGALPKALSEGYTGLQTKGVNRLRSNLIKEYTGIGMSEQEATNAANAVVARGFSGKANVLQRSPIGLAKASEALEKSPGQLGKQTKLVSDLAKANAKKQGFTEEWFRKASTVSPAIGENRRLLLSGNRFETSIPGSTAKEVVLELTSAQIRKLGNLRPVGGMALNGNSLIQAYKAGIIDFDVSGINPQDQVVIVNKEDAVQKDYILEHERRHQRLLQLPANQRQELELLVMQELGNSQSPLWEAVKFIRESGYSDNKLIDELYARGFIDAFYNKVAKAVPLDYTDIPKSVAKDLPNEVIPPPTEEWVQKVTAKYPTKINDIVSLTKVGKQMLKERGVLKPVTFVFKTDKYSHGRTEFLKGGGPTNDPSGADSIKITLWKGQGGIVKGIPAKPGTGKTFTISEKGKAIAEASNARLIKILNEEVTHITNPPQWTGRRWSKHSTIFQDEIDYHEASDLIKRELRKKGVALPQAQPQGEGIKIPEDLQPFAERAKQLSKEEFISKYNAGLKAQNLTTRDTAKNVDKLIKQSGFKNAEDFYDKVTSTLSQPQGGEGKPPAKPPKTAVGVSQVQKRGLRNYIKTMLGQPRLVRS